MQHQDHIDEDRMTSMGLLCAYCRRPLERLNSIESEVREDLHEKTEYMCTNTQCQFGSRIIYESSRPLQKQGYITLYMLHKKPEPKSRLRKFVGALAGQLSVR